jgi:hypothetical protein
MRRKMSSMAMMMGSAERVCRGVGEVLGRGEVGAGVDVGK